MARPSRVSRVGHLSSLRRFLVGADGTFGAALVEFAIFVPILVTLTLYTIDFGFMLWAKMQVQNAAQAGAQFSIGKVEYDSTLISNAAKNATKFKVNVTSSEFCGCPTASNIKFCANSCDLCNTGTCSLGTQGHYVTVTASPQTAYTPLAPYGVATGTYNINAKSTVRIR